MSRLLACALLAEEEDVVAGDDGVGKLGNDGVFVADDAREEIFTAGERFDEVVAQLMLDGARPPAGGAKFLERAREGMVGDGHDWIPLRGWGMGDGRPLSPDAGKFRYSGPISTRLKFHCSHDGGNLD